MRGYSDGVRDGIQEVMKDFSKLRDKQDGRFNQQNVGNS